MSEDVALIRQAAAIPVREGEICLIPSRSGKRWVVPKGIIDPGMTAPETALQEAWEEAGLRGELEPMPVGTYLYDKWGGTCHVTVYLMRVTEVADDWPERPTRQRRWLSTLLALEQVGDEGLRDMMSNALPKIVGESA
jgi:8-oxo-dGTP pyrophosphatase MutT (NUDIX family)